LNRLPVGTGFRIRWWFADIKGFYPHSLLVKDSRYAMRHLMVRHLPRLKEVKADPPGSSSGPLTGTRNHTGSHHERKEERQ
jgi:hypothetical protein